MCDIKGCEREGDMAPKILIVLRDGPQRWSFPCVTGLRVCASCRVTMRDPMKVLSEEGLAKLSDVLTKMRPTATRESVSLAWVKFDSKEYRQLLSMKPN